jgi:hypothetical protein
MDFRPIGMNAKEKDIPLLEVCEGCGAIVEQGSLSTCYGCGMRVCGTIPECECRCSKGDLVDESLA